MNISVIGTGYVGLVTGVCFALLGNKVICTDNDERKINILKEGKLPIYEPGIYEIISDNYIKKNLEFTTDIKYSVKSSEIIIIAVGTPSNENGSTDITSVIKVAKDIANIIEEYKLIIIKSTVPPGTGKILNDEIKDIIKSRKVEIDFDIASNPEFLREGSAIKDFLNPDRIVIGVNNTRSQDLFKKIYALYFKFDTPIIFTNIETAEMIKYASNAFLASKISFINEISNMCELCNADVSIVSKAMGLDKRIGPEFLKPGPGYGGSCFPKDTKALFHMGKTLGYPPIIIKSTIDVNENQRIIAFQKIKNSVDKLKDKTITILGTAFKPGTDDIRESPSIQVIKMLNSEGSQIKVYDPLALKNTTKELNCLENIYYFKDLYDACSLSDCIVFFTEWDEFKNIDFSKLKLVVKTPNIVDLRNIFSLEEVEKHGFIYKGVGR